MRGTYAEKQLRSPSRIIRFSHSARFQTARRLVAPYRGGRLLDFGCGDGTFLEMVHELFPNAMGVDADPNQVRACAERLRELPLVFKSPDAVSDSDFHHGFDVVVCMEVFEHCLPEQRIAVFSQLSNALAPSGHLIISVPIEIGPALLGKEIVRTLAGWSGIGDYPYKEKYRFGELLRMVFAGSKTAIERPVWSGGTKENPSYFHPHKGFNWREFRKDLQRYFTLEQSSFSPFSASRGLCSSQAWFVCRPLHFKQKGL